MNRGGSVGVAIVVLALAAAPAGRAAPAGWSTYQNARFGYSVLYPGGLLAPQPEADNGDGRHFRARRGQADVAVWAAYANGQTLAGLAAEAERDCAGGRASYKVVRTAKRPPFMALSCAKPGGQVLYAKALQCKDVITQIQFTYPAAEKAVWDAVVTTMSASLGAGCGAG
jgi:hypothetical protein